MDGRNLLILLAVLLLTVACGNAQETPEVSTPQSNPTEPAVATTTSEPAPTESTEETDSTDQNRQDSYPAPTEPANVDAQTQTEDYPAPTECETEPSEPFVSLLESQSALQQTFGCATAEAVQTNAAWQVFEHENQMVWLESEDAILAMYNGQWHAHEDTFEESSDPEIPPNAPTPPADDQFRARRGFGKVWVDVVDDIGFAVSKEEAYEATYQEFEGGWMVTTPFGQVFALEGMTDAQAGSGQYQAWLDRDGNWVSGAESD